MIINVAGIIKELGGRVDFDGKVSLEATRPCKSQALFQTMVNL